MNTVWDQLVAGLRMPEGSTNIDALVAALAEQPEVAESPGDAVSDPDGHTRSYMFRSTGVELGFRRTALNHAHLFVRPAQGYAPYTGPLEAADLRDRRRVEYALGAPSAVGGGMPSALRGYVLPWIKYHRADHSVRYEFERDGSLNKVTI